MKGFKVWTPITPAHLYENRESLSHAYPQAGVVLIFLLSDSGAGT